MVIAGLRKGLSELRSLCRRFEPRVKARFVGVLLGLLNFEFPGAYGGIRTGTDAVREEQVVTESESGM